MTLPQNVADALGELDAAHDQRFAPWRNQWQTIRAHLMSQEAEVKRLNAWIAEYCKANRKAFLADQYRLAAANALLREALQETLSNIGFMAIHDAADGSIQSSKYVAKRIQSHLQGAGDEAASSPEFLCPCGSSLCNGKEDEA